jgi:hypothetical protein
MATWITRLSQAINAFWLTLNQGDGDTPLAVDAVGWGDYKARLQRYALYEAYYSNVVYEAIYKASGTRKVKYDLYKHIRGIYNPVARQIDLLASYVYGGMLDAELRTGAIPVVTDNDALRAAIWQVFQWSRWGVNKSQFVKTGAKLGDAPIKIVDDPQRRKVRLELLDPRKIRDVEFDDVGNVKAVVIEYERADPENAPSVGAQPDNRPVRTALYTEVWDKEGASTYRNGELYGWDGNEATWANDYGFVPVIIGYHSPAESGFGKCSFYNVLRKVDEINDSASVLNDIIRKHNQPIWIFTGVGGSGDIDFSNARKDGMPFVRLGKDATAQPMVAPLGLGDALNNLTGMLKELENDMPELALASARNRGGDISLPSMQALYSDGIKRIEDARGNYDDALTRAVQMAVTIGGIRRYDGFTAFNDGSYARGDLDIHIGMRPVIADAITKSDKIAALTSASNAPSPYQRLILQELDYPEDDIEDVVNAAALEKQQQNAAAVRAVTDKLFGAGDGENGDEETDEEADANPGADTGSAGTGETGD